MKNPKVKTVIAIVLFFLVLTLSNNLFAQTIDSSSIMDQLTTQQNEMLQNEQRLMKQNRMQLRASLTEEQLAILGDPELTREQIRKQLRESFSVEQGELVQNQERRLRQVREQFRNSLTQEQRKMLRERVERTRNSRDQGEIRNGEGFGGDGERPGRNNGRNGESGGI